MDLQKIRALRNAEWYLDVAIKRAHKARDKTYMQVKNSKKLSRIVKSRMAELSKVETMGSNLHDTLSTIVKSFPSFEQLEPYYQEVMDCLIDVNTMRQSLSKLSWAAAQIRTIQQKTIKGIKRTIVLEEMNSIRKAFYGRSSSILKQVDPYFERLEKIRRVLRDTMPPVKMDLFTVAIAGFPNVGKSTLLSHLTESKPEINSYPFTTKSINIGYVIQAHHQLQLLDTPGTLNRFNKMNNIEKLAYLTMQYVADVIIYVYDLTEEYPIADQHKLLDIVKENEKPTYIYISKTDILEKEKVDAFIATLKGATVFTDRQQLREFLIKLKAKTLASSYRESLQSEKN